MSMLNIMQLTITLLPKANSTKLVCTRKDFFFKWMPLNRQDCIFMSIKLFHLFFNFSNVVKFHFVISSAGKKVRTVDWIPFNLLDCLTMGLELKQWFVVSVPWIPYYDVPIFTSGYNQTLCGVPVTTCDCRIVSIETVFLLRCRKIPNFCCTVI